MTLPRRRLPEPAPARAVQALSVQAAPTVADAATATADDWQYAVEVLVETARRRDGDDAARHTEIRRRMRALARAARTLAGPKGV